MAISDDVAEHSPTPGPAQTPRLRIAVHLPVFSCDRYLLPMLDNCGPHVDKIYIAYSKLPWTYNPSARSQYKNKTDLAILKRSPYFDKIQVIEGVWERDEDQRNACVDQALRDGYDILIIQDADEYYRENDYRAMIETIRTNPDSELFLVPLMVFWKTLDYVLVGPNGSPVTAQREFAINLAQGVRFRHICMPSKAAKVCELPGCCFHLSYVLSDAELMEKISTWGHSHEFDREGWFRRRWLYWNESTRNLHPLKPFIWKRAVRYRGDLPEVLGKYDWPSLVLKKAPIGDAIITRLQDIGYARRQLSKAIRRK